MILLLVSRIYVAVLLVLLAIDAPLRVAFLWPFVPFVLLSMAIDAIRARLR